jgi:hypothetical protein
MVFLVFCIEILGFWRVYIWKDEMDFMVILGCWAGRIVRGLLLICYFIFIVYNLFVILEGWKWVELVMEIWIEGVNACAIYGMAVPGVSEYVNHPPIFLCSYPPPSV